MKVFYNALILMALSLVVFSCNNNENIDEEIIPVPKKVYDVSYGSHPRHKLDVHFPFNTKKENPNVIIVIHGGGWKVGDKANMKALVNAFHLNHPDYAIVNMNYVLADENTYAIPGQINDISSVLKFLKDNKEEYPFSDNIILSGNSAGGHLSMFYAYTKNDNRVKAVCNIVGPSNFNDTYYDDYPELPWLLTGMVDPDVLPEGSDVRTYASPITYVNESSTPTISFYGDNDSYVPLSQKKALDSVHVKYGVNHYSYVYKGSHFEWETSSEASAMIKETIKFFKENVGE